MKGSICVFARVEYVMILSLPLGPASTPNLMS